MSQKLGTTYSKPWCSGFCHLITSLRHSLIKWCCTEKAIFHLTTPFQYDHCTCCGFNKEAPTTWLLGRFYKIAIFRDVAEGICLHSLCVLTCIFFFLYFVTFHWNIQTKEPFPQ
jgi:hypothetical protein